MKKTIIPTVIGFTVIMSLIYYYKPSNQGDCGYDDLVCVFYQQSQATESQQKYHLRNTVILDNDTIFSAESIYNDEQLETIAFIEDKPRYKVRVFQKEREFFEWVGDDWQVAEEPKSSLFGPVKTTPIMQQQLTRILDTETSNVIKITQESCRDVQANCVKYEIREPQSQNENKSKFFWLETETGKLLKTEMILDEEINRLEYL